MFEKYKKVSKEEFFRIINQMPGIRCHTITIREPPLIKYYVNDWRNDIGCIDAEWLSPEGVRLKKEDPKDKYFSYYIKKEYFTKQETS